MSYSLNQLAAHVGMARDNGHFVYSIHVSPYAARLLRADESVSRARNARQADAHAYQGHTDIPPPHLVEMISFPFIKDSADG